MTGVQTCALPIFTPQRREDFLAKACKGVKELEPMTETKGHLDEDLETKDPLIPIQDNDTRWNSWFLMIRRALNLRDAIDLFIKRHVEKNKSSLSKLDELSNGDWDTIIRIKEILQPFYMLTKRTEGQARTGSYRALWEALLTMEYLLGTLEKRAVEYGAELMS